MNWKLAFVVVNVIGSCSFFFWEDSKRTSNAVAHHKCDLHGGGDDGGGLAPFKRQCNQYV